MQTPVSEGCRTAFSVSPPTARSMVLHWFPAHCGILGNERVDGLAKGDSRHATSAQSGAFLPGSTHASQTPARKRLKDTQWELQPQTGLHDAPEKRTDNHNNNNNNNEDYLYSAKEPNERHSWRFTYQLFLHTNTRTHACTRPPPSPSLTHTISLHLPPRPHLALSSLLSPDERVVH